ncbi:hypothetical protein SMMN14_06003 [Sphaerulina musiva]
MPGSSSTDERTPLLRFPGSHPSQQFPVQQDVEALSNAYHQFCYLMGNRPPDHPAKATYYPPKDTLYHRAIEHRQSQARIYTFTSALTNTLLLTQVVLGASLTGMGASQSPGWLITVFGALNTIIAGLVAFLKSRGQPMRARMFRDDLNRVVDEIENSATMWRGISQGIHGYDAIDTDETVTVRSEVARLTRLYDRAVKTNTINDPDYYGGAGIGSGDQNSGLRSRPDQAALPAPGSAQPAPASVPAPAQAAAPAASAPPPVADVDESPATKAPAPTPPKQDPPKPDDPVANGTADATKPAPQPSKSSDPNFPAADPGSNASAPTQIPTIPPPPAATSAPVSLATIVDPDASPATASIPTGAGRAKSNKPSSKVTEDLSEAQSTSGGGGGAAKSS